MEEEFLAECWNTLSEYISAKDKQTAADHLVANLVDMGLSDDLLKVLSGLDTIMEHATEEHIHEEYEDDEWEEDY